MGLYSANAQCFKSFGPIPSIPIALVELREDNALKTSSSETLISERVRLGVGRFTSGGIVTEL